MRQRTLPQRWWTTTVGMFDRDGMMPEADMWLTDKPRWDPKLVEGVLLKPPKTLLPPEEWIPVTGGEPTIVGCPCLETVVAKKEELRLWLPGPWDIIPLPAATAAMVICCACWPLKEMKNMLLTLLWKLNKRNMGLSTSTIQCSYHSKFLPLINFSTD